MENVSPPAKYEVTKGKVEFGKVRLCALTSSDDFRDSNSQRLRRKVAFSIMIADEFCHLFVTSEVVDFTTSGAHSARVRAR